MLCVLWKHPWKYATVNVICAECLTISYHSITDCVMLSPYTWRKKVEGGRSDWWLLFFWVTDDGTLLSWNDWTPAGSWEWWMKALLCFSCVHDSCSACKTLFFSAHKVSHFYFPGSLPCPTGEGKAAAVWGWVSGWTWTMAHWKP